MSIDKTIRIGVDSSAAAQGTDNIRKKIDQANTDSLAAVKEQIRLLKEKGKIEDDLRRKKEKSRQDDINYAQKDMQMFALQRDAESRTLTGSKKSKFDKETREELNARKSSILGDRMDLASSRIGFDDEKTDRKKQLKKLEDLQDTLKGEGKKGREVQQSFLEKILTGAGMGPKTAKDLSGIVNSPAGNAIKTLYAISATAAAAEEGLRRYSTNMNQNAASSVYQSIKMGMGSWGGTTAQILGKSSASFLEENYSGYQSAYGDKNLRGGVAEGLELASAGRSRGLSQQQIEQIVKVSRYSGGESVSQISSMENYLEKTSQSLVRLPEIMTSYLQVANGVLMKTGAVDPIAIQRTMQSIGSSYGAQGVNLDRMTAGFSKMGTLSQNPIMLALQQQTMRSVHPNMNQWDKMKISEDPLSDTEYLKGLISKLKNFGGGGNFSKFAAKDLLGDAFSAKDIDKMWAGNFDIANPKAKGKDDFYRMESQGQVGEGESTLASFKELGNTIVKGAAVMFTDGLGKIFGSEYWQEQQKANRAAFSGAIKDNKNILSK